MYLGRFLFSFTPTGTVPPSRSSCIIRLVGSESTILVQSGATEMGHCGEERGAWAERYDGEQTN